MRLSYEIATVGGTAQMRAAFRGIEKEAQASNKRMSQDAQRTAASSARASSGPMFGPGRREQMAALRERERAAIASSRAEFRARLAGEKELDRAKQSLDRQRGRALMQQFNEQQRAERQAESARRSTLTSIGKGAARGVGRGVGNVVRAGGALAGIAGGLAVGSALAEQSEIRRRAAALANQAGTPGVKNQLATESTGVRGFTGSETLGAMGKFMDVTGDLDAARAAIKGIGELALATDSDFETMGEAAGNAFTVIADAVKDPQKRIEALKKVMAGWAGQGRIGAVELKDMAAFGGRIGGAARSYAGDPAELLISMGAMTQAARRAGGAQDAAEASEATNRFVADLVKHPAQKALAGLGVNVFADKNKTKLRDPAQIVADILDKTKGSLPLGEDITNAQSGKVLRGFSGIYTAAEAEHKGTGKQKVLDEFARYRNAGLTGDQVTSGANSVMEEPDKQFKEAMKQFNTAIGTELLPAVTRLIPTFTQLVPLVGEMAQKLAAFLGWAAENPWKGVGAIVAASVAKDVAEAGIGAAVRSILTSILAQTSAGGGMPVGPAGGLGGKVGAVGMAAAGVALAYDQAQSFGKENGGWAGFKGFIGAGSDPTKFGFEGIDAEMNAAARARAVLPSADGAVGLKPSAAVTPTSAPAAGGAAPAGQGGGAGAAASQLTAAAKAQAAAAAALNAAATRLGPPGQPPANRTTPIVSPSRG